jgi:hypothetical protein
MSTPAGTIPDTMRSKAPDLIVAERANLSRSVICHSANSPFSKSIIRFVHGVQQERIAFRIRKDPASARWGEPELGSNSQHYFGLPIYGREVWRLNRKSFGRFDHRAMFLNHLDSLNPQSIRNTISRERTAIETAQYPQNCELTDHSVPFLPRDWPKLWRTFEDANRSYFLCLRGLVLAGCDRLQARGLGFSFLHGRRLILPLSHS